jgi:hypothetical protein
VFSTWSVPRSYLEENSGDQGVVSSVFGSSARKAVKIGPEGVKLKNLHCYKPLPGNGW